MSGGCRVVWREPKEGEKLGVSLGMLVAKIERLDDGRYRLTRVWRENGRAEHRAKFVSSLRAVHAFKLEIEKAYGP